MIQSLPQDHHSPPTVTGPRLGADDAAELMARVAQLSAAGLPLSAGLRAAAEELPRRQARAMNDLAAALDVGQSLDVAMAGLAERIPPHLRGLVIAGLRSGKLARVLDGYLQYERHGSLMRKAWLAVAYPALLLSLVVGVVIFFAFVVAGAVVDVAKDFGTGGIL